MHKDVSNMTEGWKDNFKILIREYWGEEWNSNCFSKEMSAKEKYSGFLSLLNRYPDFVAFLPCYLSYFVIAEKFHLEHVSAGLPGTELSPWTLYNSDKSVADDVRKILKLADKLYTENSDVMDRVLEEAFRNEVDFFKGAFVENTEQDILSHSDK
jgi:thiaminase